jgi:hypothetical protein
MYFNSKKEWNGESSKKHTPLDISEVGSGAKVPQNTYPWIKLEVGSGALED